MNEIPLWILFSILGSLLLTSAFFSSSETAMMALNPYRLKHLRKKSRGAKNVYTMLKRTDRLISGILIGNNLANNFAAIVAALIAVRLYGEGAELVAGILLTLVMLIFSEVTPKTIAALYPERVSFPFSYLLRPLLVVFTPLVSITNNVSRFLVRMVGLNPDSVKDHSLSKEELRTVVDESSQHISEHQEMLHNVLDLSSVNVNQIMVPRNEIQGLDLDKDIEELIECLINSDYTRLPVYNGDIHNVVGILHIKKVTRLLRGGSDSLTKEALKRFSREPYFIPEGTSLNNQLLNFQKMKRRIGLVVDEYGEIEGLITLDDILEEIVGEFTTNQAEEIEEVIPLEDGSYQIDGTATIRDINKATGWELPESGPTTLNGLAMEHLERIPDGNTSFQVGAYRFETLGSTNNVIEKMRVRKVHYLDKKQEHD